MNYRNKKTGLIYRHLAAGYENVDILGVSPIAYVIYCPDNDEHTIYVEEEEAFYEKFEIVEKAVPSFEETVNKVLKDLKNWTMNPSFKLYSESYQIGYKEALIEIENDLLEEKNNFDN